MSDDLDIRRWTWKDKAIFYGVVILGLANLVIGILALGPDILNW